MTQDNNNEIYNTNNESNEQINESPKAKPETIKGYNDRLAPIIDKGLCGDPEYFDNNSTLNITIRHLAKLLKSSSHTVLFTGAGISTSCGISDFRGPNGIWTIEEKSGTQQSLNTILFEHAKPSFTHFAINTLIKHNLLHFVASQNVDGLHLKSGLSRDLLSELHGNIFAEHCDQCNKEFIRNYDIGGMGCKVTGRLCELCNSPLRDKTIDWDTDLPQEEFDKAISHFRKADLVICMGTSLRVRPTCNLPLRALRKHGRKHVGKLVIINLQKTHLDSHAEIRIFAKCDDVMKKLLKHMKLPLPNMQSLLQSSSDIQSIPQSISTTSANNASHSANSSQHPSNSSTLSISDSSSTHHVNRRKRRRP